MIREICKDEAFLAQKAEAATAEDLQTGLDLLETLEHHRDECVGMAANMIPSPTAMRALRACPSP